MNQEALRQHYHYASVRERLWPKVKEEKAIAPKEAEIERKRENERAKAARIAAYRKSLAEAELLTRQEQIRMAEERRFLREQELAARREAARLARIWPKWSEVSKSLNIQGTTDTIILDVLRYFPEVTVQEIHERGRGYQYRSAAARAYVMFALSLKIGNQSEVARILGRDPSTVNSAIRKVKREIEREH